jgi:hypothetical protein
MGRLHETGKGNGVESEPYRWKANRTAGLLHCNL